MSRNSPLKGLRDLDKVLATLPKNLQRNAYSAGLRAAADPPLKEARLLASGWSPKVAKAITKGSPRHNQDGTFSIRVYVDERKPDGFLGFFAEYGVKPHLIARTGPGEGKVAIQKAAEGSGKVTLRPMKIGDRFVSGIIHHPGHAAHPFLRTAFDKTVDDAVKAFADRVRGFVEQKTGYAAPVGEAA
ncbi:hypothetical protein HNO88_001582 [Novosphingobium chloroacetimidivorans]|uniref:HK97 gp10 family phage protein n=1 Tax=Novosphingobium chloroacetimidivorans TaxID=1428314 RepID=A0A7W7NV69_9SPHN|nr:HK97 gp10 family phage protein [Novosphingobium chloroacetimidivorans]MBB4858263.1 hypothetical protein [Novosphingobium chloroacetimidivorans]